MSCLRETCGTCTWQMSGHIDMRGESKVKAVGIISAMTGAIITGMLLYQTAIVGMLAYKIAKGAE